MTPQAILWAVFAAVMLGFLVVDLGILNRKAHAVSTKSAVLQSLFWVGTSLAYAWLMLHVGGSAPAADFLAAYVTEKMLSVDNLFVILLIFSYFKVKDEYRHRVLYWGILGAVVMRGIFILGGTAIVGRFHWLLYFFGAFLVWSGIKLLFKKGDDETDVSENKVFKWASRNLRVTGGYHADKFFVSTPAGRFVTPLFLVLLVVETTDVMFAFDSIPAVFAITQDPLVAFTSNIFAVMGLRALFFLVEGLMKRLRYLQQGLSAVLVFIGGKMLAGILGFHIGSVESLAIVLCILSAAVLASAWNPSPESV